MVILANNGNKMDLILESRTNISHFKPAAHGFEVGIEALQGLKGVVESVEEDEGQDNDHSFLEAKSTSFLEHVAKPASHSCFFRFFTK